MSKFATVMNIIQTQFEHIIGQCTPMLHLFREIEQVAPIDIPVLIIGESGTGKELVARAVHNLSGRSSGVFIPVNTGAIASELVSSELFGHEKGAFTGANSRHIGKFEAAKGGTLFLDEIGTMDLNTQIHLLRVLETGKFQRVGGQEFLDADARIIAATNEDLSVSIEKGDFREDLYHRFNVFSLHIPPLRERKEDIPLLLEHFVEKYSVEFSLKEPVFTKSAIEALKQYSWPGNVREFENTLMKLLITQQGHRIDVPDLPEEIAAAADTSEDIITLRVGSTLEEAERVLIQHTLHATKGNKKKTAEILRISRKALYNKLKKYLLE